jgi:hypothetical protein
MGRRSLLLVCVSLALEGSTACGGKAVSADHDGDLPGVDTPVSDPPGGAPINDAPDPEATLEQGAALYRLELRRADESSAVTMGFGCEFSERLKVYFRSHEMITKTCVNIGQGGLSGARETTALLDGDLERIRSAYDQLQPAPGGRCERSSEWLSLDVETNATDRQWLDVEHSDCPLEELEGRGFVEGLGPLYQLLTDLRAR